MFPDSLTSGAGKVSLAPRPSTERGRGCWLRFPERGAARSPARCPETESMPSDQTRFGSPAFPAERGAALLRARAQTMGVDLVRTDPVELSAAVIAADAWVLVTGRSLEHHRSAGPAASRSLAALLARAAGASSSPVGSSEDWDLIAVECPDDDQTKAWMAAVEEHARWAEKYDRVMAGDIIRAAAYDLSSAGEGSDLAGYAALLTLYAQQLDHGRAN